jgi:large conductance mechanosensitive channel
MKEFIKEFKKFALKGNVFDMAIGVVVGGAFSKIVSSLVKDIIMPLIGILTGGINFEGLSVNVGSATLTYGVFIQNVIDFLIIALVIFCVIKSINHMNERIHGKKEEAAKEPSKEELLLTEIRDLLKEQNK